MKKKVAFYTLGCKVNFCETEALKALFEKAGYSVTAFDQRADVYVINTCTVTSISDHKSRKMIRRARRLNPDAIVVAAGCYAQGFSEALEEMEAVDLVIGTRGREELPQLVESLQRDRPLVMVEPYREQSPFEMLPPAKQRGRTRGFLKIQEGCNDRCAYCIIPTVRGPVRSMPLAEVLLRARTLLRQGCKEIVLTGIHLGLYGADLEGVTLAGLLKELEQLSGLARIRLSSLEPTDITGELVECLAASTVICPHLHIALQSGDGEILQRMNRSYTPEEYHYLVNWLRQEIPGIAVSTDVIVGFPGETKEHHLRSMQFVRRLQFSRLHVFQYSNRPGTPAASLPGQVSQAEKSRRSREMIALGKEMADNYMRRFLGSSAEVLIEKVEPGQYGEGFTPHYLRVRVALNNKGRRWKGKLIRARLERIESEIIWCTPEA